MAKPSKMLVFGGSFDPPHRGHAALLAAAVQAIRPDLTWIVPTGRSPWKSRAWAEADDRLRLARTAFPDARIDDAEARSGRRVFTVETLERLKKKYPEAEIHCVIGSDLAARFYEWRSPKRLRSLACWWTADRPGSKGALPRFLHKLPGTMPEISSTDLRARLMMGDSVSGLVAPSVLRLIRSRRLYGTEIVPKLKRRLAPGRLRHSLAVARLSLRLATIWKVAEDRAVLSALLHDAGRGIPVSRMADDARRRRLKVPLFKFRASWPVLFHAYISEDMAKREFNVKDEEILKAIRHHTLAARTMGPLEKLIYVADSCSEDRNYPGALRLRALALQNPDRAFKECLREKIRYALSQNAPLHPAPIKIWNSLV